MWILFCYLEMFCNHNISILKYCSFYPGQWLIMMSFPSTSLSAFTSAWRTLDLRYLDTKKLCSAHIGLKSCEHSLYLDTSNELKLLFKCWISLFCDWRCKEILLGCLLKTHLHRIHQILIGQPRPLMWGIRSPEFIDSFLRNIPFSW